MTKALIVTPLYPGPDDRQAGIFIHRQVLNLARCGVQCRVLAFRAGPPPFPRWLRRRSWLRYYASRLGWRGVVDGIPVETVFYRRRWTPGEDVAPAVGQALCQWMRRRQGSEAPDVVYAQFLWPSAAAALALRERFGWPVAAILRGGELQEWYDRDVHCRRHVHQVLQTADRVLANCEALRAEADRLVPGSGARIEVVYNGCDTRTFRPAEDRSTLRLALGFGEHDRVLLFCGSVEPRKGIDELTRAWAAFAPTHPEWRLIVVGKCVDRHLASELKAAGNGRVRLTGSVPESQVLRFLQAADLYVQPSRLEGLANATMEAMAVGLPAISTAVWGQRELILHGENGWLVPPQDAAALRLAFEDAAGGLDRARRLGVEARRTIETKFDSLREAARLASLLADVARLGASGLAAQREPAFAPGQLGGTR